MLALTGVQGGFASSFALVADLVEDGNGLGKAVGLMGVGGQGFGLSAPIITGYLLQMTGDFNSAIWFAGALLVIGAVLACSETRWPIASWVSTLRQACGTISPQR
jgi:nitrate/nitrite transporter NarK